MMPELVVFSSGQKIEWNSQPVRHRPAMGLQADIIINCVTRFSSTLRTILNVSVACAADAGNVISHVVSPLIRLSPARGSSPIS